MASAEMRPARTPAGQLTSAAVGRLSKVCHREVDRDESASEREPRRTRVGSPISRTAAATTTAAEATRRTHSPGFERPVSPRSDMAPPCHTRPPGRRASDHPREAHCPRHGHESTAGGAGRGCRSVATVPMTQTNDATARAARSTKPPADAPPKYTTRMTAGTKQDSQRTAARPHPTDEPRNVGHCSRSRPCRRGPASFMIAPSWSSTLPPYVEATQGSRDRDVNRGGHRRDERRGGGAVRVAAFAELTARGSA
jgi:hypothetical protein